MALNSAFAGASRHGFHSCHPYLMVVGVDSALWSTLLVAPTLGGPSARAASNAHISCGRLTTNRRLCFLRWCNTDGIVTCKDLDGAKGQCPKTPLWNQDRDDPSDDIYINPKGYGSTYASWLQGNTNTITAIHEIAHACGELHNSDDIKRQCPDIFACCMFEILWRKIDGTRCWKEMYK